MPLLEDITLQLMPIEFSQNQTRLQVQLEFWNATNMNQLGKNIGINAEQVKLMTTQVVTVFLNQLTKT